MNEDDKPVPAIISKRGRYGGTYVHPLLAVDFMLWRDPRAELKLMVYEAALKTDPDLIKHLIEKSEELGPVEDCKKSYLYLIRDGNSNHYKIGISEYPKDRLKCLQIGNKTELKLIACCVHDNARKTEESIHNMLKEFKINGEWFELNEDMIVYILREYYNATI
jgi:hypothetical protein